MIKICIEKDELYPCYLLSSDKESGEIVDIPEETAKHYELIFKEFEKIQRELYELYEAAQDARIRNKYDW